MKIFSRFTRLFANPGKGKVSADDELRWWRDPLSHPAIEAMSSRELGDLPLSRIARRPGQADARECR
jgi:hypothetical protein